MRTLWVVFVAIFVCSFGVLGWVGTEIFRQAPPIPREVVTTEGQVLLSGDDIQNGQNVWQAMGGMEMGSIWGHGSYVAPDWTADYLHREALFILDDWSQKDFAKAYDQASSEQQAVLRQRLQDVVRKNNYDVSSGRLTIEPIRAQAFEANLRHYATLFTDGSSHYAIQKNAQSDPVKLRQLSTFFFWTAWASAANRPDNTISYTSNFPSEPLVGNVPTSSAIIWTGVSVIMLLAGIGWMVWFYANKGEGEVVSQEIPNRDPLIGASCRHRRELR
jgi:nitric oxide reductase subunit B